MPFIPILCTALIALSGCDKVKDRFSGPKTAFDAQAALGYTKAQVDFGPRTPGTPAHDKAGDWIVAEMKKRTDSVSEQRWTQTTVKGVKLPLRNILARFNPSATQRVLYITHWDTRPTADDDSNFGNKTQPILGANDGAAGVGLFVALADVFKKTPPSVGVDLLFVDGEDWGAFDADSSGGYPDALFGSQYFASHLPSPNYKPLFGVLWDMIGDADLQIYQEAYSVQNAPEVVNRVWQTAMDLGYGNSFIREVGQQITDDHVPLQAKGLRVIDVLDIQYGPLPSGHNAFTASSPNYHHTLQDTFDKVSAKSLQIVGDVAVTLVK
ncbi:MAG TPA: M28 family peptidase [Gemmatimonadaceae bacterium]|nr:M28 family peptidase [Gemmatimonadaceae bacterium]